MIPLLNLRRRASSLFGRPAKAAASIIDLGTAKGPVYAIGDIHGCRAELATLLDRIRRDAAAWGTPPLIIALGDIVDRGPDTAGTIDLILRQQDGLCAVLGNHDAMMLDFLREPHRNSAWLDTGGFETLLSYGLSITRADLGAMSARRAIQTIAAHVPEQHVTWLSSLPHGLLVRVDGQAYALSHAGYDPTQSPDRQSIDTLLWGRDGRTGCADLHLVQGHVIVPTPVIEAYRARLDTGAWTTGRLSCLRLAAGQAPTTITVAAPEPSRQTHRKGQEFGRG